MAYLFRATPGSFHFIPALTRIELFKPAVPRQHYLLVVSNSAQSPLSGGSGEAQAAPEASP
jgi:hypothetical protein